jgi:hypothetical protein
MQLVQFSNLNVNDSREALNLIMSEWARGNSFIEENRKLVCCICLEDFSHRSQVIELKCGIDHVFHRS